MKYFSVFVIFWSCTNISFDQKASNFANKGITCDAMDDSNGNIYICGESSVFNSGKLDAAINKDAFFISSNFGAKSFRGFSFGDPLQPERFERILSFESTLVLSGYYGETKSKFLIQVNENGVANWGIKSEIFKTFDQGDMAIDRKGNILIASKNPTDEAYLGFFHLIDKNGICQWTKKMSSIEIMQDIICTQDSHFLISFKQKGAYINGSNRKKYWMNSFHKVKQNGEFVWSKKFHLAVDLIDDCVFNKVLEDQKGDLYFMGKAQLLNAKGSDIVIVKTDLNGNVIWNTIYPASTELSLKDACINDFGNLLLIGDGYGKNGGIVFMELKPDGTILWAKIKTTANYEQVIKILPGKKDFTIIWDKLLNFSSFTIDSKGNSCYTDVKDLNLVQQNFPILLDSYRGSWDSVAFDWKKMDVKIMGHADIPLISACK